MNTPQDPNTSEQGKSPEVRPQVDARRRRFTMGGLAAPVVMGTLLSRPVLGAAPYHCTISGQISGNISPRPGAGVNCKTLGQRPESWRDQTSWPNTVVPKTTSFTSVGFLDKYRVKSNKLVDPTASGNPDIATFQEVLALDVGSGQGNPAPANLDLGRAAIASYLNAMASAPNYPLSRQQVVAMFNATINGGTYPVNPSTSWTATQVLAYFRSLYPFP